MRPGRAEGILAGVVRATGLALVWLLTWVPVAANVGCSSRASHSEGGLTGGSGGQGQGGTVGSGGSGSDCSAGDVRCSGDTREECSADGVWKPAAMQCPVDSPVCMGAGVCSAFRLAGSVDTFGAYPAQANGPAYVLKRQTLLESERVCSAAMNYCFTGGIYGGAK